MLFNVFLSDTGSAPSACLQVDRPEGWDAMCSHGGNGVGAGHKLLLPVEVILETVHKPGLWGISAAACPRPQGSKSEQ